MERRRWGFPFDGNHRNRNNNNNTTNTYNNSIPNPSSNSSSHRRGALGDLDVYVTNRYEGLVGVNSDNAVWSCEQVGPVSVDVHPDDPRLVPSPLLSFPSDIRG